MYTGASVLSHLDFYTAQLQQLQAQGNFRQFQSNVQTQLHIEISGQKMLNLSGNDYLSLASQPDLQQEFWAQLQLNSQRFSASSSRLLTGNFSVYEQLETDLSAAFLGRSALLFNSGYHINIGLLPALADSRSMILADKLVHASLIDGMRLSSAKSVRYRHNDLMHLSQLLQKYQVDADIDRIFVVTESIFSMDGDETDLTALVALKQQFSKVMLYVDDAHAIGVRGTQGLGCAEQYAVINDIDVLVGTFGKALASQGAYVICDTILRNYLINRVRSLIYSTALPPINIAWTQFMFQRMQNMHAEREHLQQLGQYLRAMLQQKGLTTPSSSHIVPIIIGDSTQAVKHAQLLQQAGFYVMPVRPPTVPQHSARLRLCLNAQLSHANLDALVAKL